MPHLPFPDQLVRLALSSHLLFTYPVQRDFDAHLTAIGELVRVTSGEVRFYPLVDTLARLYPQPDALRSALARRGVHSSIRRASRLHAAAGRGRDADLPPQP